MSLLPRFITMAYGSSFFQYETQEGISHASIRATSQTIISENNFTKFEVVNSGVRGMVHLRTSYNNKYLQLNSSGSVFFYAIADDPVEDRAKRTCTLFRFVITGNQVAFFHQSQNIEQPVVVYQDWYLGGIASSSGYTAFWFRFTDMTALVILPKHVMFKGDDGNYLRARKTRLLEFVANDPLDSRVHHIAKLVPKTGDVRLLSRRFNLYWQRINGDWIQCNAGETGHQNILNSIFRPVRQTSSVQGNIIALLNTTNNRFCERWTYGRDAGRIRASHVSVPYNAVLTVEEAIRDREISNIRYHAMDARMYDMVPIQSASQVVYNYGNQDALQRVGFEYREVTENKFTSSHSWKLSVKTSLKVRFIPKIVEGNLSINATYAGKAEWSTTERKETTVKGFTDAPVPARSFVRVTLIVGQGFIDVPFSYKQRDILMDGTPDVNEFHDGLLSGFNTFEMQYTIGEAESLPSSAKAPSSDQDNIVIVPAGSEDLPGIPVSRVVDEVKVEGQDHGKEEELVPMVMEEQDQGGEEQLVPLPSEI